MNNPPAFQFYARDWLAGKRNRMLRPAERGAHADLLAVNWIDGEIPTDQEELADLLRGLGYNPDDLRLDRLMDLFPDGKSRRLERERRKQEEYRRKKAEAGRKGGLAKAKRDKHDSSSAKAQLKHSSSNAKAKGVAKPSLASASASASNSGSVLSEPAEPGVDNSDGEPWNDRLAPFARELGDVGRWLRWAKNLDDPDRAERIMDGLRSLRDRGAIDYCVKPGAGCAPGILSIQNEGQPVIHRAEAEWHRIHRPKRSPRPTTPQKFNVQIGGAA